MSNKPKVIAIVGPTASGKTDLSIEIAKRFNGEVISADSRQVYRGLDIGTGKVTKEEMGGVPHHLIDIVDTDTVYTGTDFVRDASAAIEGILGRGRLPIIAGGTFFYIELLRGTIDAAPVEPNLELRAKLKVKTNEELCDMLVSRDPRRAETIDRHNSRRLIRALEVVDALGSVPETPHLESSYEWLMLGVETDLETLTEKIKTRLLKRLKKGMVEEVKNLHVKGLSFSRMEELGLEYRYIGRYLEGKMSYEEMVDTLATKIRRFAKRQMTWLKRDESVVWFLPENRKAIFRHIETFLTL